MACTILTLGCIVNGQQATPTPSPKPGPASSDEIGNNSPPDQEPTPAPAPSLELDLRYRETMTGDWHGTRARWKEHGVEMQFILAGFVQGTAAGGVQHHSVLNGKLESKLDIDFGKLSGWKYWSAQAKFEYRFGAPVLGGTGAINTVNTNVTVPASHGSVFAITALNVTRVFPIST